MSVGFNGSGSESRLGRCEAWKHRKARSSFHAGTGGELTRTTRCGTLPWSSHVHPYPAMTLIGGGEASATARAELSPPYSLVSQPPSWDGGGLGVQGGMESRHKEPLCSRLIRACESCLRETAMYRLRESNERNTEIGFGAECGFSILRKLDSAYLLTGSTTCLLTYLCS